MDTPFEFLKRLEGDLEAVARRETARRQASARAMARRRGRRADQSTWLRYVGAAAAVLVLAWSIGFVAQGDLGRVVGGASSGSFVASVGVADGASEEAPTALEPRPAGDQSEDALDGYQGSGTATAAPSPAPGPKDQQGGQGDGGAISSTGLAKIVRDGTLSVVIPSGSFDARFQRLFEIAAANGGFILSSETRGPSAGGVVMRIPAENFDQAILDVRELGTVSASTVRGQDVTAEYIDLSARLKILEARRTALLTILAEANAIGEILAVQNRVDDVQLEIEQIQGRLRYLDDQVDESTLRVDLREERDEEQLIREDDDGVDLPDLGRAFELAVQGTMNVLATTIVGIGYLLPLALIGVAIWGVVRLVRRRDRAAS